MAMKFMKAKSRVRPVRKRDAKNPLSQAVLDKLDEYLEGKVSEPMRWLVNFWADQAAVITYHELLNIVLFEDVPEKIFNDWFQDYSKLIGGRMTEAWEDAFRTGWETVSSFAGVDHNAYQSDQYVRSWILDRTGERITAMTNDQVQAVRYLIAEGKADGMSPTELARYIRPTIGLTERQAAANEKYYNAVKEKLREEHPRMSEESIEKKARAAAGKYAVKQQKYRAETIAQTELARAYNEGNDRAIRKMIADGVMPMQVKAWATAANEKVCPACEALEGTVVGLDEEFSITVGKKVQHTITKKLPPIHPRCKCAIVYENAEIHPDFQSASVRELPPESSETDASGEQVNEMDYVDLTEEWKKSLASNKPNVTVANEFVSNEGVVYTVDGINVRQEHTAHEEDVARLLSRATGKPVWLIPEVKGIYKRVSTPDYLVGSEKERWDLKDISKENDDSVRNAAHKKKKQANNFVFNVTGEAIPENVVKQARGAFGKYNMDFVNKIMVIHHGEILCALQRK